jgi:hypothetical protein
VEEERVATTTDVTATEETQSPQKDATTRVVAVSSIDETAFADAEDDVEVIGLGLVVSG